MNPPGARTNQLPMLAPGAWQMSYGERAALEGVLDQLKPRLAVEVGTAEGGSLARIARHSEEVHSFDLVAPDGAAAALDNVTFHTGDSHELLPRVLGEMAAADRGVDFILLDGDHSAEGIRRDVEDVLGAEAVRHCIVLLHDTMNDTVREGIEAVDFRAHPKVALVDLDFVPGYLARAEPYRLQLWGGLGLIVIDADRADAGPVGDCRFHPLVSLVRPARDELVELERAHGSLERSEPAEVERMLRRSWRLPSDELTAVRAAAQAAEARALVVERSNSWRLTAPLRSLGRAIRARRGG